ncbi:DMT family transporter [Halobacillus sp. A5]|uniref:DMT family transporter n=1 Tax=Halobacillus sp. A5 TaxID=2880263 RepID=UPI0020A65B8D|nr:EamA family transporter [Halobacillus sp. A5]MCP3029122.1 EamA family transporter [Halobacillus sp. A5]
MKLYSALIGLSLIWGLSFVFIKWLVEPAGVWGTIFLRCLAGAVVLLPFLYMKRKELKGPIPWKALLFVGIFNAAVPWGFIAWSETEINSNTAAVLNALTPICTGLVGFLFFSILLKKRQWAGIVLGFIGILVLMDFNVFDLLNESFIGMGTMILATVSYGFASQFTKRHLQHTSILLITTCSLLIASLIGLLGMIVSGEAGALEIGTISSPLVWVSIIGLGCFGSGFAHLLFYYMVKNGSAEFATSVTYIIPVTAMIWGYVLLGEPITKNLILGLVIIFAGVYLATRKPRKQAAAMAA